METSQINENAVYTPKEVQLLLKISPSTFNRLIKGGSLPASKVGGQYRLLGKDLLQMFEGKTNRNTPNG